MGAVVELTDEEWGLVKDLFDPAVHHGVRGTIAKREIVDAILWLARTGCQWRYLPARFPDWQAVHLRPHHPRPGAVGQGIGSHSTAARQDHL